MQLENKKVLITGADGFIGSHLAEMLVKRGARVKALSYYNSFNNWGWLEETACRSEIEIVSGDVRDAHFCDRLAEGTDVIFHLAALIAIPYSYVAPSSYVETNVHGTLNMCQAAVRHGCQRFIHTSTSEVYGSARYVPIDENHPLQPQSPYSASKIGADMIARSCDYTYKLPVVVARPFNTYGPRQSARAVIPTMIAQLASGLQRINVGDLRPTRDFNYVEDTCRAFVALAECDAAVGQTVNIGSGTEVTIGDTFSLIRQIMGSQAETVLDAQRLRPENSEVQRLLCDNRKIHELTGFRSQVSFEEGLHRTVEWFTRRENLAKYKPGIYNL